MSRPTSIRDRLEHDAWRNYPGFAQRFRRSQPRVNQPRRSLRWEDRVLLILAAVLMLLLIVRVETARADDDPFWGVEFQLAGAKLQAVALDTDIHAVITGPVARIDVSQVFQHTGSGWAEATYRFPLPPGAAVDRMRVEVGDRILEGEIREKAEARRQYQQARASGKVASLVEQERANQFQTRLANIAAGEVIRVNISFLAQVDFSGGTYSLQIPMTFTPRWNPPDAEAGGAPLEPLHFVSAEQSDGYYLTVEVDLNPGFPLAILESLYHDVDIHPTLDGYHLFLADPDTRSDRVFELAWSAEPGYAPESTLMSYDGGDAVYALLMLKPPMEEAIRPQPREVVFVIDTSGSMQGASIEQARAALLQGLAFMGPSDRFNLVEFNSRARLLFEESVPVDGVHLQRAADFIDDLDADGGTVMAPALELALGLPPQDHLFRQVIFITDGSVGNEGELLLQLADQLGDSRLFTVSIGSAPNAWFMRKAAIIGRGSHTHIGRQDQVQERMTGLWARIQNPSLQDLCVDWGMQAEYYPDIIPDLYAGEPLWLYARLPHEPREVTVCGTLDGRHWEQTARLIPGPGSDNIATLWARNRIDALEDSRIFGVDPALVREDVLEVALEFGLLTRYTSLVAVDRSPSRPPGQALESAPVGNLLPAGSTLSAGFSQTATGWPLQLALALISLFLATGMLLYRPPSRASRVAGAPPPAAESS